MAEENDQAEENPEAAAEEDHAAGEEDGAAGEDAGDITGGEAGEPFAPDDIAPSEPPPRGADINLDVVMEVPVNVALRVGKAEISIRQLISLVEGSVIELDRDATDPMDVLVNDTLVARGEIVVVDEKFGVRLTDVVSPNERIDTLN